jgi:hypothetical protein
VSPLIYGHLTHMLKSLAGGRVCVVLEVILNALLYHVIISPDFHVFTCQNQK